MHVYNVAITSDSSLALENVLNTKDLSGREGILGTMQNRCIAFLLHE